MLIFRPDLFCQMLAQRLRPIRPQIVVEVPKPWFQQVDLNPDLGGSGAQPLRRLAPRRVAINGNVEALQPLWQQDGPEVTR